MHADIYAKLYGITALAEFQFICSCIRGKKECIILAVGHVTSPKIYLDGSKIHAGVGVENGIEFLFIQIVFCPV